MPLFGSKNCPLAKLEVTVKREPAPTDGSKVKCKVTITKLRNPDKGKSWSERGECDAPIVFKKLPKGRLEITVEVDASTGWCFEPTDATRFKFEALGNDVASVVVRPLSLAVEPSADWKQFVNLELTPEAQAAGAVLVPHDLQEKRAEAALVKAKASGNKAWIKIARQMRNDAPGKRMDPKQLGRVLLVEARLGQKLEGVRVYFNFEPDRTNALWTGAPADTKAALSNKLPPSKDVWESRPDKDVMAKTDAEGVARVRLRLPSFGGDKVKVHASLLPAPKTNGNAVTSGDLEVWRKIWYQPTWHGDYPLDSLQSATDDFRRGFIEFEQIDPRPFAAGITQGATEQDAWGFDDYPLVATLAPGQKKKVELVLKNPPAPPRSADVTFEPAPPGVAVTRSVRLVAAGPRMSITGADHVVAPFPLGVPPRTLTGTFEVKNGGSAPFVVDVTKTKAWLKLRHSSALVDPGDKHRSPSSWTSTRSLRSTPAPTRTRSRSRPRTAQRR